MNLGRLRRIAAQYNQNTAFHYSRELLGKMETMRRMLLLILLLGLVGIGAELLLLEHTEGVWQRVPVGLILMSLIVLAWHAGGGSAMSLRVFRGTMILFLLSGLTGLVLHYRGNMEFELEMYPTRTGWELFRESMMGATPALSPGTMLLLGLLGLTYTYRHPVLTGLTETFEGD